MKRRGDGFRRAIAPGALSVGLLFHLIPVSAHAGTSESSDEHIIIIGIAVLFSLILLVYLGMTRFHSWRANKSAGIQTTEPHDSSASEQLQRGFVDRSGLHGSHAV